MTNKSTLLRVIKESSLEEKQKQAAKDHAYNYFLRSDLAMENERKGRPLIAAKHQAAAEESALWYHALTKKKIHDPFYNGNSPHIATRLGEETELEENLLKSVGRGLKGWDTTFPRFNDLNDPSKGTNRGHPKDIVRNTRNKSDEFLYSVHKRKNVPEGSPAALQQRVARNELERRRKTGKLDPKYHIKADNIKTRRTFGV